MDGYAGYQTLFDSGQAVDAGGLAHARRKFFELWRLF
ncbi:IS66 family transposase [Serratia symbiotica]